MQSESSNTEPRPESPPVLALVSSTMESMAVDAEDALTILDAPDSSESARSLAMSTLSAVPPAIRFFCDLLTRCTLTTEESTDE